MSVSQDGDKSRADEVWGSGVCSAVTAPAAWFLWAGPWEGLCVLTRSSRLLALVLEEETEAQRGPGTLTAGVAWVPGRP